MLPPSTMARRPSDPEAVGRLVVPMRRKVRAGDSAIASTVEGERNGPPGADGWHGARREARCKPNQVRPMGAPRGQLSHRDRRSSPQPRRGIIAIPNWYHRIMAMTLRNHFPRTNGPLPCWLRPRV